MDDSDYERPRRQDAFHSDFVLLVTRSPLPSKKYKLSAFEVPTQRSLHGRPTLIPVRGGISLESITHARALRDSPREPEKYSRCQYRCTIYPISAAANGRGGEEHRRPVVPRTASDAESSAGNRWRLAVHRK